MGELVASVHTLRTWGGVLKSGHLKTSIKARLNLQCYVRILFEWPGSDIFTCEWGNMIVRCDRDTPHQKTRVQICNGNARIILVTDYVSLRETLLPSAPPPSIVSTFPVLLWHITVDRWCNKSYKILLPHCPLTSEIQEGKRNSNQNVLYGKNLHFGIS